jgi:pyruvate/2-oxoglutarate/acetoin dehydrogenase E1 component
MGVVLMKYKNELIKSMSFLGKKKDTIFLGQSVLYSGNAIYNTLTEVPLRKKIELPVFEDVQMGMSVGMALNGFVVITCFPRFDFLICAMNQLVNHLDKIRKMSRGEIRPKVLIRTSIGSKKPLDGGPQHTQNYTDEMKKILSEVKVVFLNKPGIIFSSFKSAYEDKNSHSYLFVEHGDFYNDK